MTELIITTGLTKFYGEHRGVIDIDLRIGEGEVFGLLGPNGAGKTTCIRLFLDLIHPTSGSATLLGLDSRADSVRIRQAVGYLPGDFITYEKLTGRDLLEYFVNLRGHGMARAESLAERFDLDLTRKIGELSRGNRQKVGLVQAFMSDPRLLILDEPGEGIQPNIVAQIGEVIRRLIKEDGLTVLLVEQKLPFARKYADRFAIMDRGRRVAEGEIAELSDELIKKHLTV